MPARQIGLLVSSQSDECQVLAVDPALVGRVWLDVAPMLAPAFNRGIGDLTLDAVKTALVSGAMLLWVAWSEGRIIAAVATELVRTPRHKLCVIACCGGEAISRWLHFIGLIEAYAKAEQCDVVRVMGRRGWERMLPGYAQPWIVLDKNLRD